MARSIPFTPMVVRLWSTRFAIEQMLLGAEGLPEGRKAILRKLIRSLDRLMDLRLIMPLEEIDNRLWGLE